VPLSCTAAATHLQATMGVSCLSSLVLAPLLLHVFAHGASAASSADGIICSLVIEGGSNMTAVRLFGTSIATAELSCTGGTLKAAVHPLLAPFSKGFKGVDLAKLPPGMGIPSGTENSSAAGFWGGVRTTPDCVPSPLTLVRVCDNPTAVTFAHVRVANVMSSRSRYGPSLLALRSILQINGTQTVRFLEPVFDT